MYRAADRESSAPEDYRAPSSGPDERAVEQAIRTLIAAAGDDPDRPGLIDTPGRVSRAYREWFAGYSVDPATLLACRFDAEDYDGIVVLRGIKVISTCEHHLAPIIGTAHVGYLPDGEVVGISKLARLVDAFARRLQLQERLTRQVAQALDATLTPRGVGVVIEATHGCMSTRGVNVHGVSMVTECWLGEFKTDARLRDTLMRGSGAER